jgi:hypothetical protein
MGRLKMLVLAALTAVTVGVGALAAAPSAFAEQNERTAFCAEISRRADYYIERAEASRDWVLLAWLHSYYSHQADLYTGIWWNSCR